MITTVLAFLLTLGVLIAVHEYGHYRVAVACGVKVLRYSIGFGPVLWRRQATPDSTEFVLAAVPLGGYVRMLDEREAPVDASERAHAFNAKTLWQRSAIVAAGPLANLLLAMLLFSCTYWIGIDEPRARLGTPVAGSLAERAGMRSGEVVQAASVDGTEWIEVRSINDLVWSSTQAVMRAGNLHLRVSDARGQRERQVTLEFARLESREVDASLLRRVGYGEIYSEPVMGAITPGGAAAAAGVLAGDRVLSVDGVAMPDAATLRATIRASALAGPAASAAAAADAANAADVPAQRWLVERSGQTIELTVRPAAEIDHEQRIGRVKAMIGAPPEMVDVQYAAYEGVAKAANRTWDMAWFSLKMFGKILTGEASLKNLTGPITIADYAGQSVRVGFVYYLGFLAGISVSLGVFNLLPLPMLDGGHLMYHLFEAVVGRPIPPSWLERLQRGGVVVMLMLMSVALFNDVARLLGPN
jgi:regulator of sigma E protease